MTIHHNNETKNEIFIPTGIQSNHDSVTEIIHFLGHDEHDVNACRTQNKDEKNTTLFSFLLFKLKNALNTSPLYYYPMTKNKTPRVTYTYELWHFINGKKHIIDYDSNDRF